MRGLISLALILFVALSAQASAKTIIKCTAEQIRGLPSGEVKSGYWGDQFISYDTGKGSKIKNISLKGGRVFNNKSDDVRIEFNCEPGDGMIENRVYIDRTNGDFVVTMEGSEPLMGDDKKVELAGKCKKVEPRF